MPPYKIAKYRGARVSWTHRSTTISRSEKRSAGSSIKLLKERFLDSEIRCDMNRRWGFERGYTTSIARAQ